MIIYPSEVRPPNVAPTVTHSDCPYPYWQCRMYQHQHCCICGETLDAPDYEDSNGKASEQCPECKDCLLCAACRLVDPRCFDCRQQIKLWPYAVHDVRTHILLATITVEGPPDGIGVLDRALEAGKALFLASTYFMTAPPLNEDGSLK